MATETANWQNAFDWLEQNWSSSDETWAQKKEGFVAQLWLSDPAQDPYVTDFLRRVDEELTTDEERRNTLTDEPKRNAFFAAAQSHAPAPPAQEPAGDTDDTVRQQGYSTDHEQAKRLGIAYWDATSQRYLTYDEATQEWREPPAQPASGDSSWDTSLNEELPFASLSDEEIAALFSAEDSQPTFAHGVSSGEVAIQESAPPAVTGSITAG
jgi:hypothetical protein